MSTALYNGVGPVGYNKWCVVRDGKTVGPDGTTQFRYKAIFAPVYSMGAVKASYLGQEDAERMARMLSEQNVPF